MCLAPAPFTLVTSATCTGDRHTPESAAAASPSVDASPRLIGQTSRPRTSPVQCRSIPFEKKSMDRGRPRPPTDPTHLPKPSGQPFGQRGTRTSPLQLRPSTRGSRRFHPFHAENRFKTVAVTDRREVRAAGVCLAPAPFTLVTSATCTGDRHTPESAAAASPSVDASPRLIGQTSRPRTSPVQCRSIPFEKKSMDRGRPRPPTDPTHLPKPSGQPFGQRGTRTSPLQLRPSTRGSRRFHPFHAENRFKTVAVPAAIAPLPEGGGTVASGGRVAGHGSR